MIYITKRNISIKKIFLLLIFIGSVILIVIIFNIRYTLLTITQTSNNLLQQIDKIAQLEQYQLITDPPSTIKRTSQATTLKPTSTCLSHENKKTRPWFLKNGQNYPRKLTTKSHIKLFPEELTNNDRIINQLMYIPTNYIEDGDNYKVIYLPHGSNSWGSSIFLKMPEGGTLTNKFKVFNKCPVSRCTLTSNKFDRQNADAILYKDGNVPERNHKTTPSKQVWIMYLLECPYHTGDMPKNGQINWTATYRLDSDIVAPYERWVAYSNIYSNLSYYQISSTQNRNINFAKNKTKKVAWFVSNCFARNKRLQYGTELQKFIDVDIYGSCGNNYCPRGQSRECFRTLERDYKFYLAFENSNCKDYITEKFFVNGLGHNIIPIVMGGTTIEEYTKVAPQNSFIHVNEFNSAEELSEYLKKLDEQDHLYNKYFKWKHTGEFINTYFWCRLCAMLHSLDSDYSDFTKHYANLNEWWRGQNICKP